MSSKDAIRVLGFVFSALVLLFLLWSLIMSPNTEMPASKEQFLWFLAFILSGPMVYFFVSSKDNIKITTPAGTVSLFGPYAAVLGAYMILHFFPPGDRIELRHITLQKSNESLILRADEIEKIEATRPAQAFLVKCGQDEQAQFILDFNGLTTPAQVIVTTSPSPLLMAQSAELKKFEVEKSRSAFHKVSIDWP